LRTSIGYVVKLRLGRYAKGLLYTESIADADVFFNKSDRIPVVVTEEPGPPVREVVELRGTVDLDGIKFALQSKDFSLRGSDEFWHASPGIAHEIEEADVWATIDAAVNAASHAIHTYRLVGIREVPGPTVRTVTEITPEMLK